MTETTLPAEAAAHRRGLDGTLASYREMQEDEAMTRRAFEHLLGSRRNDAYEAALAAL